MSPEDVAASQFQAHVKGKLAGVAGAKERPLDLLGSAQSGWHVIGGSDVGAVDLGFSLAAEIGNEDYPDDSHDESEQGALQLSAMHASHHSQKSNLNDSDK